MHEYHISLLSIALAALINLWLMIRCGRARTTAKIAHGDGGDVALGRHMRAHSNFVEYTPIAMLLVLVLELSGQAGWLLAMTSLAFLLGRVLHPLGMQADKPGALRLVGILATVVCYLILGVWAALVAFQLV